MRRAGILIVAAALLAALSVQASTAESQGRAARKIVARIAPFYPDVAKHMRLAGVVKLEVVVKPNGTVKSAKPLGGSPLLIQSASDAVLKWKFEAAPDETTEVVQVAFQLQ
ncbi:MAG: energy transducer TonB [Terriglobales bacterium]